MATIIYRAHIYNFLHIKCNTNHDSLTANAHSWLIDHRMHNEHSAARSSTERRRIVDKLSILLFFACFCNLSYFFVVSLNPKGYPICSLVNAWSCPRVILFAISWFMSRLGWFLAVFWRSTSALNFFDDQVNEEIVERCL